MSSPSEQTLLVTGANGFVAGHIIKVALGKGYRVKGAVRTDSSAAQLKATFPKYSSQLSTVIVSDISQTESFKDAFGQDVTGVIHTASVSAVHSLLRLASGMVWCHNESCRSRP